MAVHSRQRQHEARWARVNVLLDGFKSTENQRWASVKSLYSLLLKSLENDVKSFSPAGVSSRVITPSSSSSANHRSQMKTTHASDWRSWRRTRFKNHAGDNPSLLCQTLRDVIVPKEPSTEIMKELVEPCLNVDRILSFRIQIPLSPCSPANLHDTWAVVPAPLLWPVKNVSS